MKKKVITISLLFLISVNVLHGGLLLETIEKTQKIIPTGEQPIFIGVIEKRQKQLEQVKKEKEEISKIKEEADPVIKGLLEEIKGLLNTIQNKLKEKPDDDYLKRKSTILNETFQTLKDVQRARKQLGGLLDDLIKLLQEFLNDPDFSTYKKEQKLQERLFYSFKVLFR